MEQIMYTLKEPTELTAQPASELAATALNFHSNIKLGKDENIADAKKIFSIMSLPTEKGGRLIVTAEGADERAAIQAMQKVLQKNL